MMSISQAVIVLCALGGCRVTANIHVDMEDIVLDYLDPEYFDVEQCDIHIVDKSTTHYTVFANITLMETLPLGIKVNFQLFELSMGEYNVSTGLDVTFDLCRLWINPIVSKRILKPVDLDPEVCPPEPGNYLREVHTPILDSLPVKFPENKYLARYESHISGRTLSIVKVYLDVKMK